jgi:hypothetical protein
MDLHVYAVYFLRKQILVAEFWDVLSALVEEEM